MLRPALQFTAVVRLPSSILQGSSMDSGVFVAIRLLPRHKKEVEELHWQARIFGDFAGIWLMLRISSFVWRKLTVMSRMGVEMSTEIL